MAIVVQLDLHGRGSGNDATHVQPEPAILLDDCHGRVDHREAEAQFVVQILGVDFVAIMIDEGNFQGVQCLTGSHRDSARSCVARDGTFKNLVENSRSIDDLNTFSFCVIIMIVIIVIGRVVVTACENYKCSEEESQRGLPESK